MSTRNLKRPPANTRRKPALPQRLLGWWQARHERRAVAANQADDATDSETEPPPRIEWSRWFGIAAVAACVLLGAFVALHFNDYTQRTQQFHVARFEIGGQRRMTRDALIARSGVHLGDSLMAVDRAAASRSLESLPWVRRASVQQQLPSTLAIQVIEYQPFALLLGKRLMLVDRGGHVFKEAESGEGAGLPILTGLPAELTRDGGVDMVGLGATMAASMAAFTAPKMATPQAHVRGDGLTTLPAVTETPGQRRLRDLLALVEGHARSPVADRFPLSEVHWDAVLGTTLISAKDGSEVRMGPTLLADQTRAFAMLARLLDRVQARGEWLKYAYLDDELRGGRAVVHAVPLGQPAGPAEAALPMAPTTTQAAPPRDKAQAGALQAKVSVKPASAAKPTLPAKPALNAKPAQNAKSALNAKPTLNAKPALNAKPTVAAKPAVAAKPVAPGKPASPPPAAAQAPAITGKAKAQEAPPAPDEADAPDEPATD